MFYGAAPYLHLFSSIICGFIIRMYRSFYIFVIGIIADLMMSNILGGRATAMILLAYVIGLASQT